MMRLLPCSGFPSIQCGNCHMNNLPCSFVPKDDAQALDGSKTDKGEGKAKQVAETVKASPRSAAAGRQLRAAKLKAHQYQEEEITEEEVPIGTAGPETKPSHRSATATRPLRAASAKAPREQQEDSSEEELPIGGVRSSTYSRSKFSWKSSC